MSDEPVSPVEVRWQIWESLVSMLRVYTHAASLNHDGYGMASHPDHVRLTHGECALYIRYSPQTGAGQWHMQSPGQDLQGSFEIDDHSQVVFPEGPRELDEAAIHWVQQLGQSICAV